MIGGRDMKLLKKVGNRTVVFTRHSMRRLRERELYVADVMESLSKGRIKFISENIYEYSTKRIRVVVAEKANTLSILTVKPGDKRKKKHNKKIHSKTIKGNFPIDELEFN